MAGDQVRHTSGALRTVPSPEHGAPTGHFIGWKHTMMGNGNNDEEPIPCPKVSVRDPTKPGGDRPHSNACLSGARGVTEDPVEEVAGTACRDCGDRSQYR